MRYYQNNDKKLCDVGEILSEQEIFDIYYVLGLDVKGDNTPMTSEEILEDFVNNHDGAKLSIQDVIRRRL
jgi:hypothetical protein